MTDLRSLLVSSEALERHLGDPTDQGQIIHDARTVQLDDAEAYPTAYVEEVYRFGLQDHFVPVAFGGDLDSYHRVLMFYRALAGRDPTLSTVAMLSSIGYAAMLIAGTDEQKRQFGDILRHGGQISWALSEAGHGSDIVENDTIAVDHGDHWRVSGRKWPIGLYHVADYAVVQARTSDEGGAADATLMILDKRRTPRSHYAHSQTEPLHGVRGLDLGELQLNDCPIPKDAVIGGEGRGLEIALQTAQLLRSGVIALSVGGADRCLRIALDFACKRWLFERWLIDTPVTRLQLTEAFADVLIADMLMAVSARTLHVAPERLNLYAAISKYAVPTLADEAVASLATVLGTRYFMRRGLAGGLFQKLLRDISMVNFVDGNSFVNLKVIGLQMEMAFRRLATAAANGAAKQSEPALGTADATALQAIFDLAQGVPAAEFTRLKVFSGGNDVVLAGLPATLAALEEAYDIAPDVRANAVVAGRRLLAQLGDLAGRVEAARARLGKTFGQSPDMYDFAKRYALIHAAASCLHMARYNRTTWRAAPLDATTAAALGSLDWLPVVLARLERRLDPQASGAAASEVASMTALMLHLHDAHRAFSIVPHRLAAGMPHGPADAAPPTPTKLETSAACL